MLRRIATVALIIGSAAALLIGSSTYAPFTDDGSASGGVGAGSVNVTVNGGNGSDVAQFDFSTQQCSNMAPGHPCEVDLIVDSGTSTLSATWETTVTDTDDPELDCFTVTTNVPTSDGTDDEDVDPGYKHEGKLTVNVADDNNCQSAQSTITVRVVATQSATPHN